MERPRQEGLLDRLVQAVDGAVAGGLDALALVPVAHLDWRAEHEDSSILFLLVNTVRGWVKHLVEIRHTYGEIWRVDSAERCLLDNLVIFILANHLIVDLLLRSLYRLHVEPVASGLIGL